MEAGQNIIALKNLLGHADIRTTLVYLHVARLGPVSKFGCLEDLYGKVDE